MMGPSAPDPLAVRRIVRESFVFFKASACGLFSVR